MSDIEPKSLDPKFREELRKHAWEYFKLHAEQRTRVFNFYVLLTVAMVAGLLTVLKEAPAVPYAASAICVMIVFFSFIFLQLDTRHARWSPTPNGRSSCSRRMSDCPIVPTGSRPRAAVHSRGVRAQACVREQRRLDLHALLPDRVHRDGHPGSGRLDRLAVPLNRAVGKPLLILGL